MQTFLDDPANSKIRDSNPLTHSPTNGKSSIPKARLSPPIDERSQSIKKSIFYIPPRESNQSKRQFRILSQAEGKRLQVKRQELEKKLETTYKPEDESELYRLKLEEMASCYQTVKDQLKKEKCAVEEAQNQLKVKNSELEAIRMDYQKTLDKKRKREDETVEKIKAGYEHKSNMLRRVNEENKELVKKNKRYKSDLDESSKKLTDLENKLNRKRKELKQQQDARSNSKKNEKLAIEEGQLVEDFEQYTLDYNRSLKEKANLETELQKAQEELKQRQDAHEESLKEKANLETELQKAQEELKQQQDVHKKSLKEKANLETELQKAQEELKQQQDVREKSLKEKINLEAELFRAQKKLKQQQDISLTLKRDRDTANTQYEGLKIQFLTILNKLDVICHAGPDCL